MLEKICSLALPLILLLIFAAGLYQRKDVYNLFLSGAKEGLKVALNILPSILGLLVAISMLKASGFFELVSAYTSDFFASLGLPDKIVPLALLRPVSGSGGIALLTDILKECGPDSLEGRIASVIAGATETTFYTIAVYFASTNVSKTRHTLPSALTADFTGILMSAVAVRLLMGN